MVYFRLRDDLTANDGRGTYSFSNYPISYSIPIPPYVCNIHLFQSGTWTAGLN